MQPTARRTESPIQNETVATSGAAGALALHWREYLMEAACLGFFMISACVFGVLLEHPQSFLRQVIDSSFARRALMGVAMGLTAAGIICSKWGQRSGAHMNPAVTIAFLTLRKIRPWDALFYVAAQFAGGALGVWIAALAIGSPLRHYAVNYVTTAPGPLGPAAALCAELFISLVMMSAVLLVSNSRGWNRWTPAAAATLVALFITFEAPLSGMSMNPARTFGSAFAADQWTALWIYFVAPLAGMLGAAQLHLLTRGKGAVFCAKLHHHNATPCIFRCNHGALNDNRESL